MATILIPQFNFGVFFIQLTKDGFAFQRILHGRAPIRRDGGEGLGYTFQSFLRRPTKKDFHYYPSRAGCSTCFISPVSHPERVTHRGNKYLQKNHHRFQWWPLFFLKIISIIALQFLQFVYYHLPHQFAAYIYHEQTC